MGDGALSPDPLPADMVSRVLRRAAEISSDPALEGGGTWTDGGVSEDVLVAAAAEVGIEPEAVRRAVALERLGPPPPQSAVDGLIGPAVVSAETETPWSPDDTLRLIDSWLCGAHHLRRERTRRDGGEWRRRSDWAAKVQRQLRNLNGEGRLGEAGIVTATALPAGESRSVARLTVDRRGERTHQVVAASAVTGLGVVGAAALAVAVSPLLALTAPLAVIGGVAVAAQGRKGADQSRREAERLLEAVQRGEWPRSVTADVRDAFRRRGGDERPGRR